MPTPRELGQAALKAGDADAALGHFQSATEQTPTDGPAWAGLGMALCQLRRLPEGIEALQQAVSLSPAAAAGHYNLGYALQQAGRSEEALASYRRTIALDPNHARAATAIEKLTPADPVAPVAVPPVEMPEFPTEGLGGLAAGQTAPTRAEMTESMQPPPAVRPPREERDSGGTPAGAIIAVVLALLMVVGGAVIWFVPPVHNSLIGMLATLRPGPLVTVEEGGFKVRLPGGFPEPEKRTQSSQALGPLGSLTVTVYSAKNGDDECSIVYTKLPDAIFNQAPMDKIMEGLAIGLSRVGAQQKEVKDVKQGELSGKELRAEATRNDKKTVVRARVFVKRPGIISLAYGSPEASKLDSPVVLKFFESLDTSG